MMAAQAARMPPSSTRSGAALVLLLVALGCGGPRDAVREALATENPARADAPLGAPPVAPDSLRIAPPSLPPTEAPAIDPEPVKPMDDGYKMRRMPSDAGGGADSSTLRKEHR